MWYEKIIESLSGPQIINDSKTPSGRVHVGSLRGVLIHDALYRALRDQQFGVIYSYGIDDFDPLDGLPADAGPTLREYMGFPLCNISAPEGSTATDLADHYISEFLGIFTELGVGARIYRMRDVYRSGQFNEAIDTILRKSSIVRKVYAEVSKAVRPDDWHPFQVICENCGKIGTTEVTAYDGQEVTYHCRKDLVKWASGCGHRGQISPFDGRGKLPWKLEWTAKWHTFGITIEGAGKDHCTKGGSRDVAEACLREIFGEQPPLNVPYEFFLVSGAKMSSSKGIGTAAREIANFLPAEILRFLMIQTPPKRTVNFSTDFEYIVKLFNEHDRLVDTVRSGRGSPLQEQTLRTIEVSTDSTAYHPVGFQLLTALLQLPHIDVESEINKRVTGGLSDTDRKNLQSRLSAAQYWLDHYASEEDRVQLQESLPASAADLSAAQKAFLKLLGQNFPKEERSDEDYQKFIFDTARLTPLEQKEAFAAIYRVLLDQDKGPKAGSLFAFLDKAFLINRFNEVDYSRDQFWNDTGITTEDCRDWFTQHQEEIASFKVNKAINTLSTRTVDDPQYIQGKGVLEVTVTMADGKTHLLRVLFHDFEGETVDLEAETNDLESYGEDFINEIATNIGLKPIHGEKLMVFSENGCTEYNLSSG
jgi:lysyl-tRNA synthetase class 1